MTKTLVNVQTGVVEYNAPQTEEDETRIAATAVEFESHRLTTKNITQEAKLTGILIEGVMCSATDEDQQGMIAIGFGHLKTGAAFKPTKMKFKNGNELAINVDNIAAVEAIWLPFRQSFFTVEA